MFFKKKKNIIEEETNIKPKRKVFYIFRVLFIILVIIGLYILFNFIKIFNSEGVKIFEVTTGEIVNVDRHKGFIFRDEGIASCQSDGYINYYVTNAARVKRGAFIYTINDEPSQIKTFDLNNEDKKNIRQNIKMYSNNITNYDFSNIYNAKDSLDSLIDEINLVKQLEDIDIEKEINAKEKGFSKYAGVVSFIIDGYETSDINDFTDSMIKKYDGRKKYWQVSKFIKSLRAQSSL